MTRNVAIFCNHLFKFSESFIWNQASGLDAYRPVFVGRDTVGPVPDGVQTITRDGASFADKARMILLRDPQWLAQARTAELELVHAHFGIDAVYAMPLAQKLGIPLVTTLHGHDVTKTDLAYLTSGKPALMNYLLFRRKLWQASSQFICVSEAIRKKAIAKGFPAERCRVHYIGIDTSRLEPRADAGEDGLIVHVARLVEQKGTLYLIRAMERVLSAVPHAKLVIIGEGPLKQSLMNEVAKLGLGAVVRFTGSLPNHEVLGWVRKAALMAVPSVTTRSGEAEGLGMVVLEASCQGVPVVASNSCGIPEAVRDGETGYLVAERDFAALADSVSRVLRDSDLRLRMGRAGRTLVEDKFVIKKQCRKLEAIYDRAIDDWSGQ